MLGELAISTGKMKRGELFFQVIIYAEFGVARYQCGLGDASWAFEEIDLNFLQDRYQFMKTHSSFRSAPAKYQNGAET